MVEKGKAEIQSYDNSTLHRRWVFDTQPGCDSKYKYKCNVREEWRVFAALLSDIKCAARQVWG